MVDDDEMPEDSLVFIEQMGAVLLPIVEAVIRALPSDDELVFEMREAIDVLSESCSEGSRGSLLAMRTLLLPAGEAPRGEFPLVGVLKELADAWNVFHAHCEPRGSSYAADLGEHLGQRLDSLSCHEVMSAPNQALHVLLVWSTDAIVTSRPRRPPS